MVAFVLVGLVALPTYFTGEPAEASVEHAPGVTESVIGPHEESAEASLITVLVLAVLSLAGLILYRRREVPSGFTLGTLALALIVTGMMAWTAHLGGRIRHVEIRGESAGLAVPAEKD
jgi:uncharacterized membrane protein AbrB (regulator of aidB expression)